MTVKELLEELKDVPEDTLVVMSRDAEGNGHSPLSDVGDSMYLAESTWSGEVKMRADALTDEMRKAGYSEDDCGTEEDGYIPAIVLWPTN